jgi:uncharacterized protein (DUF58 family)
VALAVGLLLVGGAVAAGGGTATTLALLVALTLLFFAFHSAWRMAQALTTVADAVPVDPDVSAGTDGKARLAWPSLSLVVRGQAAVLREPDLEAEVGGQPMRAPVDEPRQLAEDALDSLGVQPVERPADEG